MDAEARGVLDYLARLAPAAEGAMDDTRWLENFRYQTALLARLGAPPVELHSVSHVIVPRTSTPALAIRLYRPRPGKLPLLLHMHGGGAIAGSVDGHDAALRMLARRTGWLVAAPLYRRAPEHRFPAQLEDGWHALWHLREQAEARDIDASIIAVSGDSIGGTLATALAMRERDAAQETGRPPIAGQILLYPNTDLRRDADYSSRRREDGHIIALADLERQIDLYLSHESDRHDPLVSPVLADPAGLPPTLLVTCGGDPLCDEGAAYARLLTKAGVPVHHEHFAGMIHAFMQTGGHTSATARLFDCIADWLQRFARSA
ncbi:MAG: alpha/beta hydrolase [Novosphingobium sp.]